MGGRNCKFYSYFNEMYFISFLEKTIVGHLNQICIRPFQIHEEEPSKFNIEKVKGDINVTKKCCTKWRGELKYKVNSLDKNPRKTFQKETERV